MRRTLLEPEISRGRKTEMITQVDAGLRKANEYLMRAH